MPLRKERSFFFEKSAKEEDREKGLLLPNYFAGQLLSLYGLCKKRNLWPLTPCFLCGKQPKKFLELANGTPFGLGAVVFTKNEELGEKWARDYLQAGSCYVNGMVKSNPSLPFWRSG